jgi:hypothetical protein
MGGDLNPPYRSLSSDSVMHVVINSTLEKSTTQQNLELEVHYLYHSFSWGIVRQVQKSLWVDFIELTISSINEITCEIPSDDVSIEPGWW